MKVHLVDGTYELFRHHFGQPSHVNAEGMEVAATRGVAFSLLGMLEEGATHMGVATDHVIESFRNEMWPGYKSSEGVAPELLAQFPLLEEVLVALGLTVWPMVELEADDALASAAAVAGGRADQVLICTPDKDLAQCVVGERVVQLDRRRKKGATPDDEDAGPRVIGEDEVWARFGVGPASIPDYLALVGDSADGFPGLAGWGAKSAATVLARYGHLEAVPDAVEDWEVSVRGGAKLAATLASERELAALFKDLATLRTDAAVLADPADLAWQGPGPGLEEVCRRIDAPRLLARAEAAADH